MLKITKLFVAFAVFLAMPIAAFAQIAPSPSSGMSARDMFWIGLVLLAIIAWGVWRKK